MATRQKPNPPEIIDEPGMRERFQRGLQRALNTPPQHRTKPRPKPKSDPAPQGIPERPALKGARGKTRS